MQFEKYERYEIDGTDLTFEIRKNYLRLYEGWSEEYIIIEKRDLDSLYETLARVRSFYNENRD